LALLSLECSAKGGKDMRKSILLLGVAAVLAGCGKSTDDNASANIATNNAAAEKPRAYCFFQDDQTKDWKVKTDKSGNVVVSGKAFRSDPRYRAILSPATVSGATAETSPTLVVNDTGFAAPENWWEVSQTIPDSAAITKVAVTCGGKTIADLEVPRNK